MSRLVSLIRSIKLRVSSIFEIILYWVLSYNARVDKNALFFVPHGGAMDDAYSLMNGNSDNALSLANYIIRQYGNKFRYYIAVHYFEKKTIQNEIGRIYPNLNIICVPYLFKGISDQKLIRETKLACYKEVVRNVGYIFSSETLSFPCKSKNQELIYLGYYIPFKRDYGVFNYDFKAYRLYDYWITTSLLSSQIISLTYDIPINKFYSLGFSRNDSLFNSKDKRSLILERFQNVVDYDIRKILLYTPTHRDYEEHEHNASREILGFDIEYAKLEHLLKEQNAVIICKIHSKQNKEVLANILPKGVLIHEPNEEYGLCELLSSSDILITDYTSTYFDFLLLNKPVIFNFYDYDRYNSIRGFSYDPLESIIAGDVFTDGISFLDVLEKTLSGNDVWDYKRKFVRDMMHKFRDNNSSKRICNFIFNA